MKKMCQKYLWLSITTLNTPAYPGFCVQCCFSVKSMYIIISYIYAYTHTCSLPGLLIYGAEFFLRIFFLRGVSECKVGKMSSSGEYIFCIIS